MSTRSRYTIGNYIHRVIATRNPWGIMCTYTGVVSPNSPYDSVSHPRSPSPAIVGCDPGVCHATMYTRYWPHSLFILFCIDHADWYGRTTDLRTCIKLLYTKRRTVDARIRVSKLRIKAPGIDGPRSRAHAGVSLSFWMKLMTGVLDVRREERRCR